MKRFFIVILSFLMLFPLMAEEDFFELCKTGTALQISAAIKAGASSMTEMMMERPLICCSI